MAKLTKLYNDFLLSKEEKNILVFDLDSLKKTFYIQR